jgi:hypothetical protein
LKDVSWFSSVTLERHSSPKFQQVPFANAKAAYRAANVAWPNPVDGLGYDYAIAAHHGGVGMSATWPLLKVKRTYIRRAMPFQDSKSLTDDELYAVSAYILSLNEIIGKDDTIAAQGKDAEPRRLHPVPAQPQVAA